jgi:uncharacterized membrane protein
MTKEEFFHGFFYRDFFHGFFCRGFFHGFYRGFFTVFTAVFFTVFTAVFFTVFSRFQHSRIRFCSDSRTFNERTAGKSIASAIQC